MGMHYRPLGNTGLRVSVLSFGASPLGGAFGAIDEAEGIRAVHAALDLGINLIDTSPYYGRTRSEAVLGRALRDVPRERYLLSTKVGRIEAGKFDFSTAWVRKSVEESLQRLGVERVDLLFCHDIEFVNVQHVIDEAIPALRDFQRQGKIRFVGVSGYPLAIYPRVLSETDLDVVLSYARYNLTNTTLTTLLPELSRRNAALVNASPMAMGLLTGGELPPWHPAPSPLREACLRAFDHCTQRGKSLPALALQFALAEERIPTTLVGMSTVEMVAQNVRWASEPLDEGLLNEVQAILRPVKDISWPSGLPENN
jgi:L-galactose dehydrogenase